MSLSTDWQPSLPPVDPTTLPALLACYPIVVLHCRASWNSHDRTMDAHLQELRTLFTQQIAFFSFDTDPLAHHALLQEWKILNLPALLCFHHSRHVATLIGVLPRAELETKLKQWLQQPPITIG